LSNKFSHDSNRFYKPFKSIKMKRTLILKIVTIAIVFSSCQRQISADFLSDKSEYVAGDIVKLTNKSTNAKTYKWTLPDGQVTTSEHVDYPILLTQKDGSLTFKLEAISKNEKESDEVLKSFTVKAQPQPQPDTIVTFDGFTYSIVELPNGQAWMGENLRTTVYANGDPIPNVKNSSQWQNLTTGAWAYYNNDIQLENPYGKLYNWYTVADSRNVCPTGWHVPSDSEWKTLTNYLDTIILGGINFTGGAMKSIGTQYWLSPNTGATNESGFSGLPGGNRSDWDFSGIGSIGVWWTFTEINTLLARNKTLFYSTSVVGGNNSFKTNGSSVRCLRD
jgi:uncharacterized protein (TIGR02145 family)